MDSVGKVSTVLLAAVIVFCAANWELITTAWRYRRELEQAANVVGPLKELGVIE